MKVSSATYAKATDGARSTGPSSARRRSPTTVESFALAGPSDPPDRAYHAYRRDLADVALAGRVIASHYAQPVERLIAGPAELRVAPSDEAELVRELSPDEPFRLLEDSLGWAWGYAGEEGIVGYVRSDALRAP